MFRKVRDGKPFSSTDCATICAPRAASEKSNASPVLCSDTAIPGGPSSAASNAPDTVPEYVTSSPRFHPLLMPDTTRSGMPRSTLVMAMLTQSVGVPSTAYTRSRNRFESERPAERQRVSDRARFGQRGHDRHFAEGLQCIGQRFDAFRVHAVIVGYQDPFHIANYRSEQVRAQTGEAAPRGAACRTIDRQTRTWRL